MPKKLYKIEQGKVICGVCGGVAEYLDLDPNIIRLITVLMGVFCAFFPLLIAYIVIACILPDKSMTF
ncbi:MAG: PspC domain-containing protein [Oscillospiraceae bacterium]|nr:PspC domain-containing protein [Oscillospiraceae bacterium]